MQQWTISRLDCDMQYKVDFRQEPATINSVVGLRSSKALLKAKLAPKGHRHCLLVCCLFDPLQLSESQQNHYIWEACSANRWDASKTTTPIASTGQKSPTLHHHNALHTTHASEVERTGLGNFVSSSVFTWPLINQLPLPQTSWQLLTNILTTWKTLPQPAGHRKCFSRVHWIPRHGFLYYRNKQIYFSLAKVCWL